VDRVPAVVDFTRAPLPLVALPAKSGIALLGLIKMARRRNLDESETDDGGPAALASGRVTDALREAILTGRLHPGSRVRQEELAEEFGISRIPVREALRRLESEGLVILVPNSGAWIAKLDRAECIEIYKIRERLEPLALKESSASLSATTVAKLDNLVERMEDAADVDGFLMLDREFHLLSYEAAQMPHLLQMINKFWNSTQHYRRAFTLTVGQDGMRIVHSEHRLIVEAIKRRDGEQAGLVLYGHIRRTRLELQQHDELFA
jgi:DNA-binding GntR family transcriptional regulator